MYSGDWKRMFGFINRVNQVIQTPFICKEIQVLMFPVLVLCTCTCKRESQRVYTRNVSTQISLQSLWQNYMYPISSVLVNLTFVSAIHVHVQFQGSKDDAVLRALASQQSAGPIPRLSVIHCMWVQFVVSCDLCSERFSSGYSSFPFSSKANTSKFQFDLESVPNYM